MPLNKETKLSRFSFLKIWCGYNFLSRYYWHIHPYISFIRLLRCHHHHHHHIVLVSRISLTLSRHFSLSFIASGRSSGLHPVSSHSCWMYVRAGRPAFARPYMGVHKNTSLMSSSLLLHQCPACLVRLSWIVFVIGGRWPYSWCLVGVAARTCSRLLAAFFCNCRSASSPAICKIQAWIRCGYCYFFNNKTPNHFELLVTVWIPGLCQFLCFFFRFCFSLYC